MAIFWEEDWSGSATLIQRGWGTGSCVDMNPGGSPWSEGCNPTRSTQNPFPGKSHSLKEDYTGGVIGGDDNKGVFITRDGGFSTNDLWIRYYSYTTNFTYGHSKAFYIRTVAGGQPFIIMNAFGDRNLSIFTQGEKTNSPPCSGAPGGPFNSCNYYANMAAIPLADNRWYCVEIHVKHASSTSVNDGLMEMWVDGVQILGYYGRNFYGSSENQSPFGGIRIYTQIGTGLRYFGPFACGSTRIGCSGGGGGGDTTPPSVPANLAVHSTGLPAQYTWDASTGDPVLYKIYRKTEACAGVQSTLLVGTSTTTSFTDTTIPVGTTAIGVQVSAIDAAGNESAKCTCVDESLTPPGGGDTFAYVTGVTTDTAGADLTFAGKAHKIRFFTAQNDGAKTEVTGLGGVSNYRHNHAWVTADGNFVCYEAQGSDGLWQTQEQVCNSAPVNSADVTPPAAPTGLTVL